MGTRAGAGEQVGDPDPRGRPVDDLGIGRPAAPHRDDDHPAVRREETGRVAADGGLPDPLRRPHHGERGDSGVVPRRRAEREVGARVLEAGRERVGDQAKPRPLVEHRLVAQVDDPPGAVPPGGLHHRRSRLTVDVLERHAVVGLPVELLDAAQEQSRHHGPIRPDLLDGRPDDGRIVLAVDEYERRAHQVAVGTVCFS